MKVDPGRSDKADGAGQPQADGSGSSPVTTWVIQVVTVLSALVLFLRSSTPAELAVVVAVSVLFSVALWRVDWLHARDRLDPLLLLVCALTFAVLVAANLVLSERVDNESSDRADAEGSARELEQENAQLSETNEGLRSQIDGLRDDADRGDEAADPATDGPETPTTSQSPEGPDPGAVSHDSGPEGIYSNGNAQLPEAGDKHFDFDQWELWFTPGDGIDISVADGTLSGHNGAALAPTTSATHAQCGADQTWVSYVTITPALVNQHFCVLTDEGRRGALTITGVLDDGDSIAFVATIWKTPGD